MPKKAWINKKTASHFTLVHRPQNDPLVHDASASSMVLNPTPVPNSHKTKKLHDLASELGDEVGDIRDNEGEAATHGVFFDDSRYDYMQHLKDLGNGEGFFVPAKDEEEKQGKRKGKMSLEDALRELSVDSEEKKGGIILDEEILPSKNLRKATYQAQQDIPDALAGFQPDMDPRLREVLEALEDEAYVDDSDDIFHELAKEGEEVDEYEFEASGEGWDSAEEEEDGWESDDTAKPYKEYKNAPLTPGKLGTDEDADHGDGDWMKNFSKFKKDMKSGTAYAAVDMESSIQTTTTNGGRRKKRKGALTNPSSYSMTSSSLFRTEGLTTLDARFDKMEEQYNAEFNDDDEQSMSGQSMSSASSVQGEVRGDFHGILDEFLGSYSMSGKRNVKKGQYQSGMEQLDEVRRGLGPARIKGQKA
ncbi:hypothetical protein B7494_g4905 [Chlorociboria aeruginascens]|nr:hypothetical protein B7494_g4905 [Chlorociboria aeruginascens]